MTANVSAFGAPPAGWSALALQDALADDFPGAWGMEPSNAPLRILRSTNLTDGMRLDLCDVAQRDLPERIAARLALRRGDILLEKSGGGPDQPVGRVALVENDMPGWAFSNFIHLLRPNGRLNARYLGWALHYLNATKRTLRFEQQTTQMRNLNLRGYLRMLLLEPPTQEQEAIADVLDAVDHAIEATENVSAIELRLKAATLSDLFRRTALESAPKRADDEFEIMGGFTLGEHRRPGLRPRRYLRVANVQRGFIDLSDVAELDADDDEFERRQLREDDLLVVEGHADPRQIGRCARVPTAAAGMTFQNHLFRLRPLRLDPVFACEWLNSRVAREYWWRVCASTSGLHTINRRQLRRLPVLVPSVDSQKSVAAVAEALDRRRSSLASRLNGLRTLKRGLMNDLLTGRVRVTPLLRERVECQISEASR